MLLNVGIDVGSTTVKVVVLDLNSNIIFKSYERHFSKVREKTFEILNSAKDILEGNELQVALTGSAGLGLAKECDIEFVQEVFATAKAVEEYLDDIDVAVELGGEDAKIVFFTGGLEERMNGSCAGGTGAFIDQMATLLGLTVNELDKLSLNYDKIYSIASRCGVFAKSDIQPLLNQGAKKENIAMSIYQAVVDQTITGLAQGRRIEGKVVFLGGPLSFLEGLRNRFKEYLGLDDEHAVFPENSAFFIALGACLYSKEVKPVSFSELTSRIVKATGVSTTTNTFDPLFNNEEEYEKFLLRHNSKTVKNVDLQQYSGDAYLGIDAGSTTTKLVLITPDGELLYKHYTSNQGNPIDVIKGQLDKIYELSGDRVTIKGSGVTGYGEDLIKNAFSVDEGLVETVAHFYAASFFNKNVDFIIDIGGQDIKCFKVKNGVIDSIMLNEACSSGCGSFIETFAKALSYSTNEFSKLALFSKAPVDLGSRCTVFMNSSVKQAQKDGASIEDISAGIAMSVVKNAIYKVIRESNPKNLGENIVVQGGTFLNDAVLRSFELELGYKVTRPAIAEVMGAFGAALYAISLNKGNSTLITKEDLKSFSYRSQTINCNLCNNKCSLTVNHFAGGKKYISGNRCERPLGKNSNNISYNMFKYKLDKLNAYKPVKGPRGVVGFPMGLNFFETLPFWHVFFTKLGFEVVTSPVSSRELYSVGQHTIPSDTVCYPAKLMHGHIEKLIDAGVDMIFYPCMPYNIDEKMGDNHYNCPVVAYYPELLYANIRRLKEVKYLMPYLILDDERSFIKSAAEFFEKELSIPKKEIKAASILAFAELKKYLADIRAEGMKAIEYAKKNNLTTLLVAGRPYHIDPEINHGIDQFITSHDCVLITEDCVSHLEQKPDVKVLNQWTYHSRLYAAANYVAKQKNMELVQLVSFGCGIDAITTDEMRHLLESQNKLYTQIKIDEINNLGAIKIRIRSLLAAIAARNKESV